jgi:hypothetical protein
MKLFSILTAVAVSALVSTAAFADDSGGGFSFVKTKAFAFADTDGHAGGSIKMADVFAKDGVTVTNDSQVSSTASITPINNCGCNEVLSQSVSTNQQSIVTGGKTFIDFASMSGGASLDATNIAKSKTVSVTVGGH